MIELHKPKGSDIEELVTKVIQNDYDLEITAARETPIKQTVKDILLDERFGKEHAFEAMPCNHKEKTRLAVKNCERCKYNIAELWLENTLNNAVGNETLTTPTGIVSLKGLIVKRGRYDDCIGVQGHWQ